MPAGDQNTIEREMHMFAKAAASALRDAKVIPDAKHVTKLALEMFRDYRGNNPRDIADELGAIQLTLAKMESRRCRRCRKRL